MQLKKYFFTVINFFWFSLPLSKSAFENVNLLLRCAPRKVFGLERNKGIRISYGEESGSRNQREGDQEGRGGRAGYPGYVAPPKESPSGLSWACCRLVNILCSAQKEKRGSSFSEHEETGWK